MRFFALLIYPTFQSDVIAPPPSTPIAELDYVSPPFPRGATVEMSAITGGTEPFARRGLESLSEHEKEIVIAQAVADARIPRTTLTNQEVATEFIPGMGYVKLGDVVYTGLISRVFTVKGRDLVVKYQCSVGGTSELHPLINDYWVGIQVGNLGLGPTPHFLSPAKELGAFVEDKKTAFRMEDAMRKKLIDQGSLVRFMVTERIGLCLYDLLEREGVIPLEQSLDIVIQVIGMLKVLHSRGIIHGDVHPGNVCFASSESSVLKFIDFGHSSLVIDESDLPIRPRLSRLHLQHTPWELGGFRYARRDDVFKAFFMLGPLSIGEENFWRGIPQILATHPEMFLAWKRANYFPRSSVYDPIKADRSLSESQKLTVRRAVIEVASLINALHSVNTPIPYDQIIAILSQVKSILQTKYYV